MRISDTLPARPAWFAITAAVCAMTFSAWWLKLRDPAILMSEGDKQQAEAALREQQRTMLDVRFAGTSAVPGQRFPSLNVAGWLNGRPNAADLREQVWVVHIWDDL